MKLTLVEPERIVYLTDLTNLVTSVKIPEKIYDTFRRQVSDDMPRAYWVAQSVLYSGQAVSRASRELRGLFGDDSLEIERTVGDLLDITGVSLADLDAVQQVVTDLHEGLRDRYLARTPARRKQLGQRVFSNPIVAYVESIGWSKFIQLRDVEKLDSRYNDMEDSQEILYRYHDRQFLLANCGTGDIVLLPVGNVKTCQEAQAWLAGDTVAGSPLPKLFSLGRT